jgi:hypothetical protein
MPNAIKYSTIIPTGSLLKGTVALGVTTASISGPTSTTGWYYGPNPVAGKYQIIETAASGDPDVYCPQSDAELIQFVKTKGATGSNTSSVAASLAWIGTQPNLIAANFEYENIVTSGLVLNLDAGFVGSYPTTASIWYDISGNNNSGTLTNSPAFNSANSGSIVWDGVDDYADTGKTATQLGFYNANYTMEAWVYPTILTSDRTMFGTDQTALRQGLHLVFRSGVIYQGHYASDFSAGTVAVNNWYQIVYTFNASNGACEIFKNGVSQGTGTIQSFIGTTNILIARWAGTYNFQGNGSIYRIYNRVLTQAEVTQNYNAQKGRFGL